MNADIKISSDMHNLYIYSHRVYICVVYTDSTTNLLSRKHQQDIQINN
jgi:hypothetical protein